MLAATLMVMLAAGPKAQLVEVRSVIPNLVVDMRYATENNFLKTRLYPESARCLLLDTAAQKLKAVADALKPQGFRLKVYDCYRPLSVQKALWKRFPKPGYVADPKYGSHHNRGAAVDLTLVTMDGVEVEMPTPFDTFSKAAHHSYRGGTLASQGHRDTLRRAMEAVGFKINRMEWWHYELPDAGKYPVRDDPF